MDELAYGSRMVGWAPLGKLLFTVGLLIVGLVTKSIFIPVLTFLVGLALMAYSTNMKVPAVIGLALGEAILILVIGCGMISILGSHSDTLIYDGKFLWFTIYMTDESFDQAWLVFMRAMAGITLIMAFATSTPIPHLAQSLKKLHIPVEIVELIVLIYRYSFLLLERAVVMWDAAACRLGFSGTMKAIKTVAGILSGIFIYSMETAERSDAALACRNYQGIFPVYRMPATTSWAYVVVTVAACVCLYIAGLYTEDWIEPAHYLMDYLGVAY